MARLLLCRRKRSPLDFGLSDGAIAFNNQFDVRAHADGRWMRGLVGFQEPRSHSQGRCRNGLVGGSCRGKKAEVIACRVCRKAELPRQRRAKLERRIAVLPLLPVVMLCGLRNVQKAHHQMKGGIWDKKNLVGRESEGKTLGIIGYGRIGSLLARKARGIGMKVITFNPPPRHEDGFANFVDSLDQLLAQADVISVHVPATENTVNLISKENISRMKDGVFIINTSRGEVVDEDALYEACKNGKVLGAALDVYRSEPYKGKLLELDNVYFTPHLGASTKEAQARIGRELVEILRKELKG